MVEDQNSPSHGARTSRDYVRPHVLASTYTAQRNFRIFLFLDLDCLSSVITILVLLSSANHLRLIS